MTAAGRSVLLALVLTLAMLPVTAVESEDELGNWVGATSNLRYSDKWRLFLQGEVRTWELASNLNELLFRISGKYDLGKKHVFAFGYVRVDTWPFTDERFRKFYENRFFQEFQINTNPGKGKLGHRFRLEQRWITTEEFGTEYSNRARYKVAYTHPLNRDRIEPGAYYLKVLNEIFVDFDSRDYWFNLEEGEAGLNQNRLLVSGGRKFGTSSKFEFGLLWQHRPKADYLRLVLAYSHDFDFRPKGE
jgi:hypothetical protein